MAHGGGGGGARHTVGVSNPCAARHPSSFKVVAEEQGSYSPSARDCNMTSACCLLPLSYLIALTVPVRTREVTTMPATASLLAS